MRIALAIDDGAGLSKDFAGCRAALVFDLANKQITNKETRRAAEGVFATDHPLLSLLGDCTVLFAGEFDHDSLHAITKRRLRPLLVADTSLTVDAILTQLAAEALRVKAPHVCTEDHGST